MERALEWFGGKAALVGTVDAEWKVRIFSDCICVAKAATEIGVLATLEAISSFSREMIASGFPIRGGAAIGPFSESDRMIFSIAQIEAYDLESTTAQYPRVVISAEIMRKIESISDDEMRLTAKEYVIIDQDERAFVNFLIFEQEDAWLGGHEFYVNQKRVIEKALGDATLPAKVREKYEWMAHLHNWSLFQTAMMLKKFGEMDQDNVWSFSSLLVSGAPIQNKFRCLVEEDLAFHKPWREYEVRDYEVRDIDWIREWPGTRTEDDEPEDGE
jgi:hypothetical protein